MCISIDISFFDVNKKTQRKTHRMLAVWKNPTGYSAEAIEHVDKPVDCVDEAYVCRTCTDLQSVYNSNMRL